MKSLLKHVASCLVLAAAGGSPLLWPATVAAQYGPGARTPDPEVQRRLDELYQRNGMRRPNMTPEEYRRSIQERMRARAAQHRGTAVPGVAATPQQAPPVAAPPVSHVAPASATRPATAPPAAPAVFDGAPVPPGAAPAPVDYEVADGRSFQYRRSSTLKPGARRNPSRFVRPSSVPREAADPTAGGTEPSIPTDSNDSGAPVPPVQPDNPAYSANQQAPRRGFVLFGERGERSSFLGRLFGGDDDQEALADVPPTAPIEGDAIEAPMIDVPAPVEGGDSPENVVRTFEPARTAEKPVAAPMPTENEYELPVVQSRDETPESPENAVTETPAKPIPDEGELTINPRRVASKTTEAPATIEPKATEKDVPLPPPPTVDNEEQLADHPLQPEEEKVASRPSRTVENPDAKPLPPSVPEERDPRLKMIASRKGKSGLKGFCPVVLRDDRRLVDADKEFAVVHKSRTYYVSSAEALRKFEGDPEKYAPVASGHDVILLTVEGRRVEGSLEHAVWYKDRLHLFSSKETLGRFVAALNRDPFAESDTRHASGKDSEPKPEKMAPEKTEEPKPIEKPAAKPEIAKPAPARITIPEPMPIDDEFDPADFAPVEESAEETEPKVIEPEEAEVPKLEAPKSEAPEAEEENPFLELEEEELGPEDGEKPTSAVLPETESDATESDEEPAAADSFEGEPTPSNEEFENPFETE